MMDNPLFVFTLYVVIVILGSITLTLEVAAIEPPWGDRTHFCGVSHDQSRWHRGKKGLDNRNYARSFANLNVGQARVVRLIYFTPNDYQYRADVVQQMKDEIRTAQTFYAEQMKAHGYGQKTFRFETDSQGEPRVHHVAGDHPFSFYDNTLGNAVVSELEQTFDFWANIYFIVLGTDALRLGTGVPVAGVALWRGKNGGAALVANDFSWPLVAHELGHTFGLEHDFRDGLFVMSYGKPGGVIPSQQRLSQCNAEYLAIHTYFNPNSPIEMGEFPTVELISPKIYPASSQRIPIRVEVSDPNGLHQIILCAAYDGGGVLSVKACRGLGGKKGAVIEFDYDGVIPFSHDPVYSASTSLLNPLVHPIVINAVDMNGNLRWSDFVLFSDALQPLSKISGDNQLGLPNTALPVPFVVEVRDLDTGSLLVGIPISFTVTAGGGRLSVEHTETNLGGRAASVLTLGAKLGTNTVEVSAGGIGPVVTFNAVAGDGVGIPDPRLRAAVETALGKSAGEPIAQAEMATLDTLEAIGANISDLTGLEVATHLEWLNFDGNLVSDLSPLAGLTNLTHLFLWGNTITDLSPLAGLTNLTHLFLSHNTITDLSPLVANTGLGSGDEIAVRGNPLSYQSIHTHIPALQQRGVTVEFDTDGTRPPDVNGDGVINVLDLIQIAESFGTAKGDLNGDGVTDVLDLMLVSQAFRIE